MSERKVKSNLDSSIESARQWLKEKQFKDGYWVGHLLSNQTIDAEIILLHHVIENPDEKFVAELAQGLLNVQREDGSWEIYYGAPKGDINSTVESYAAMRCAGFSPEHPALQKAREWILSHGGLKTVRNFTKIWLAMIGEWPWDYTPTLPPEIIFLPKWMPFNLYKFASWARETIVPLTVVSARRITVPLPADRCLDELFPQGRDSFDYKAVYEPNTCKKYCPVSIDALFYIGEEMLRLYTKWCPIHPGRELAIKVCLEWILKHQEADGCWGGIQAPWVYSIIILHHEGYPLIHPSLKKALDAFHTSWTWVDEKGGRHMQSCQSPVWDTSLSLLSLADSGATPETHKSITPGIKWVLNEQLLTQWGDWQVFVPDVPKGGWAFEFDNDIYPDCDDTAVTLTMLQRFLPCVQDADLVERMRHSIAAGFDWLIGMQCSNGGWAAFDKDNNSTYLLHIPFADYGELLDPPSVDVTSHVLEALALKGYSTKDLIVKRAVRYLHAQQEADGSWWGRWGVNYVYGTGSVLPALAAVGVDMNQAWVRKAAAWLVLHQNDDGSWGESCISYIDAASAGKGDSTASQTAWALMGLLAFDSKINDYDEAIQKGANWLASQQKKGTWEEPQFTGTGFAGYGVGERIHLDADSESQLHQDSGLARGFMIKYSMYCHYFPLMALSRAKEFFSKKK